MTEPLILDDAMAAHLDDLVLAGTNVAIIAPGGYGKTTLLRHLGHAIEATGTPVHDDPGDPAGVLLVDDAHLLDDAELARLADAKARLIVAARPWPRAGEMLAQEQLVPGPFDLAKVRAALPARLRTDRFVEFVHAQTGGVPGFVARLARVTGSQLDGSQPTSRQPSGGPRAGREHAGQPADGRLSGSRPTGDQPADREHAGHQPGREHPGSQPAGHEPSRDLDIPAAVLAEFRPELARADETVLRFLLAADAGVGLHLDLLVELLGTSEVHDVVEAARATGLVGPGGALLPIAQLAVRALVPVERRAWVRQRLAELQLARGGQVLPLMRSLATTGIGGAGAARAFEAAAGEALQADPALAARLYAAAVTAGRPGVEVGARRAEALALSGDLDGALRLADDVLTTENAPRRKAAAAVAAAALAHRGQLVRSAQLYRWAGLHHLAAIGTIGTGTPADHQESDGPPTSLTSAIDLMAQGLRESVTGTPTTALSMLVRAAATLEPVGRGVLLPDSPAALGAILALHHGELGTAASLLDRAIAAGTGGAPLVTRHRLLLAWIAMVRGSLTEAHQALATVRPAEPRDVLFAVAIELGVARRAGDTAALRHAWVRAGEAVLRHPVDLYTFLPLGELVTAAARLRDETRLATHLDAARTLLAGLGDPPLWATPLWWGGLHAAIIADQRDVAAEHAAALTAAAERDEHFGTLAAAARCWLGVVDGAIEPDAVEDAAHGLHGAGFTWDAARLAGRAATKTSDRAAMVRLLDCARMVQGKPVSARRASTSDTATVELPVEVSLSDRELQVAELVVSGMTYKDVGNRLFISAKTVEHHVARMRQRLGATSRSELLSQLRTLVGSSVARE